MNSISDFQDIILFTAVIATYAENMLLYFYLAYIPYYLIMRAIGMAIQVFLFGGMLLFIVVIAAEIWHAEGREEVGEQAVITMKTYASYAKSAFDAVQTSIAGVLAV